MNRTFVVFALASLAGVAPVATHAQQFDSAAFNGVRWREIGPYSGGRSVTAAGSAARPSEYYMGTSGGGV